MNKYVFTPILFLLATCIFIAKDSLFPTMSSPSIEDPRPKEEVTYYRGEDHNINKPLLSQEEATVLLMNVGWSEHDHNIGIISFDLAALSKLNIGDKLVIISDRNEFALTMVDRFSADQERDIYNFVGEDGSDSFIINTKSEHMAFLRLETEQISVSEYLVNGRAEFHNLKDVPQGCSEIRVIDDA